MTSVGHACTSSCASWASLVGAQDRVPGARDAVLVGTADDLRDLVEVEDRRRRRDLPLERARVPRVGLGDRAALPADDHVVDEQDERGAEHEGRDGDEEIEVSERRVVVEDTPWHPSQADVVHREERRVEAEEGQPEVPFPERLRVHAAGHLREPVVDAGVDREHRSAEEHVVDVRDDEVRVRRGDVDRHRPEVDPGEAADDEHRDEPEREQHRRRQMDRPRQSVAIHENTLIPVGMAIRSVVIIIGTRSQSAMPATNMWCAQTEKPSTRIPRSESAIKR